MIGFSAAEEGHVISVIPPIDGNGGAPVVAQAFSMKLWQHATIIIQLGAIAAAPTSIILKSASTSGGVGTAMPFQSYDQTLAQGPSNDVLSARKNNLATGITSVTSKSGTMYVVELDQMELPDGSPWVQLVVTCPGSSILMSAVAILSASRDARQSSPTVTS